MEEGPPMEEDFDLEKYQILTAIEIVSKVAI